MGGETARDSHIGAVAAEFICVWVGEGDQIGLAKASSSCLIGKRLILQASGYAGHAKRVNDSIIVAGTLVMEWQGR